MEVVYAFYSHSICTFDSLSFYDGEFTATHTFISITISQKPAFFTLPRILESNNF